MNLSVEEKFFVFINTPLAFLTSLELILSAIVLSRIQEVILFVYLKHEILFALIYSLILVFGIIVKCPVCFPHINKLAVCAYRFYAFNFLLSVSETASVLMGIMAALSCFCILGGESSTTSKWTTRFLRLNPNLAAIIAFMLSILLFVFEVFVSLPAYPPSNNITFECVWINYFKSPPHSYYLITALLVSYGLLVIVLVIVNGIILIKVKRNWSKTSLAVLKNNAAKTKRRNVEQKLTKLTISDCLNLVIGRFPFFILVIVFIVVGPDNSSFPFASLGDFMFLLSLNLKLVFLLKLNVKFKRETLNVIFRIFKCRAI